MPFKIALLHPIHKVIHISFMIGDRQPYSFYVSRDETWMEWKNTDASQTGSGMPKFPDAWCLSLSVFFLSCDNISL